MKIAYDFKKNWSYYFLTFLVLSILLKDFFKILTYFIGINVNYLILPLFLIGTFYFYFIFIRRTKNNKVMITLFSFYFLSTLLIIIHTAIANQFNYSLDNVFLIIFFFLIFPITLMLSIEANPERFILICKKSALFLGGITFIVSFSMFIFLMLDKDGVIDFFVKLMKVGVIVNPIQSHSEGIELRFSGIFYSALALALFCNVLIVYILFLINSTWKKIVLLSFVVVLLLLTINRNGIAMFAISLVSYLIYLKSYRAFIFFITCVFIAVICCTLLIPFALHLPFTSFFSFEGGGILTKISTLFSRFSAWLVILNFDHPIELLFGIGVVQGMGDSDFYIDNSFYYFVAQSGIFTLALFLVMMSYVFLKLRAMALMMRNSDSAMSIVLFTVGFFSMILNNSFYEIIYQIYFFALPIAQLVKFGQFKKPITQPIYNLTISSKKHEK